MKTWHGAFRVPLGPLFFKADLRLYESDTWVGGYYSYAGESKDVDLHILMADIDGGTEPRRDDTEAVWTAGRVAANAMDAPALTLIRTKKGWHLISVGAYPSYAYVRWYGALVDALGTDPRRPHPDLRHLGVGLFRRCWTLRFTSKAEEAPGPVTVVRHLTLPGKGPWSRPHLALLSALPHVMSCHVTEVGASVPKGTALTPMLSLVVYRE